tara:strand:+ start:56051 stop:56311 length:261 start_codon:yes stop_codon:yes gene_type:complete
MASELNEADVRAILKAGKTFTVNTSTEHDTFTVRILKSEAVRLVLTVDYETGLPDFGFDLDEYTVSVQPASVADYAFHGIPIGDHA